VSSLLVSTRAWKNDGGGHTVRHPRYEIICDVTMTLGAWFIGDVGAQAVTRAHLGCSLGGGQALE